MVRTKLVAMASLLCAAGLMGGCASVSVHPVSVAEANNPSVGGVRFYQSAPYLLVTEMPTPPQMMIHPGPMGMRPHGPGMAMRGQRGWHGRPHGPRMGMKMHRMPPMMMRTPAAQRMMMMQIIYLPDFSKPYVANFNNPFSHHKNSIVLANGWELMGINVKGHVQEPPPIRAIGALSGGGHPGGPMPFGHPMMGPGRGHGHQYARPHGMRRRMHTMQKMRKMHHLPAMRINRWRHMMMARRAAMMIGLMPGLYQFVYSPKTGQLMGLRRVRILPGMAPFCSPMMMRMMMHHPMWRHKGAWGHGKK